MKVLVAGDDQRLLISLRDELRKDGHSIVVARGGGRAIEMCVTESPDLVIMDEDISVIPVERLVPILKNNPKLEKVPFLFIARSEEKLASLKGINDIVVKKEGPVVGIVRKAVQEVAEKIEREREITVGEAEIEGNIEQMSLLDLLQILTINQRGGTVVITSPDESEKGYVYLEKGFIINAMIGKIEGEKALFRLLKLKKGKFEFVPGRPISPVRIKTPPDLLLMEAMRHIDEYEKKKSLLPKPDDHVRIVKSTSEIDENVSPIVKEILLLAEFYPRVGDIVENCSFPDYEVYLNLKSLIDQGILSLMKPVKESGRRKEELIPPEVLIKLMEKVEGLKKETAYSIKPKVLVMYEDEGVAKEFLGTLKDFEGFVIDPKGIEAGLNRMGSLGRYTPAENLEIEFFTLPVDINMKPLWSFFAGEAMGAIVLLKPARDLKISDSFREMIMFYRRKVYRPVYFVLITEGFKKVKAREEIITRNIKKLREIFGEPWIAVLNLHMPSSFVNFMKEFFERVIS